MLWRPSYTLACRRLDTLGTFGFPRGLVKTHCLLPTALPLGSVVLQKARFGFCFSEVLHLLCPVCHLLKT